MLTIPPPSPLIPPKDDVYLGNFSLYQKKTSSMKSNILRKEGISLFKRTRQEGKGGKKKLKGT
jgi:hypothetical protein